MVRLSLIVALSSLLGAAVAQDDDAAEERPIHERIDLPSFAACGGCHLDVTEEWADSLHHRAWSNANVRQATNDFNKKSCRPCHSPMPVLPTGLDVRPDYRDFNQPDGVHCLSCHGLADGVAASRTIPDAPCNPIHDPRLQRADLCWPCHEPTHQAFQEYETSDAFAVGVRCADCHMPVVEREGRGGRSHGPHGGQNPEFVRRAIDWEAELDGREVVLRVRNRTGHKFPGEIPSRSCVVVVEFPEAADPALRESRELWRKPHKGEEREDNRLRPDETRELRFPIPDGPAVARVRILFRPLPLLPDTDGFLLGAWSTPDSGQ